MHLVEACVNSRSTGLWCPFDAENGTHPTCYELVRKTRVRRERRRQLQRRVTQTLGPPLKGLQRSESHTADSDGFENHSPNASPGPTVDR